MSSSSKGFSILDLAQRDSLKLSCAVGAWQPLNDISYFDFQTAQILCEEEKLDMATVLFYASLHELPFHRGYFMDQMIYHNLILYNSCNCEYVMRLPEIRQKVSDRTIKESFLLNAFMEKMILSSTVPLIEGLTTFIFDHFPEAHIQQVHAAIKRRGTSNDRDAQRIYNQLNWAYETSGSVYLPSALAFRALSLSGSGTKQYPVLLFQSLITKLKLLNNRTPLREMNLDKSEKPSAAVNKLVGKVASSIEEKYETELRKSKEAAFLQRWLSIPTPYKADHWDPGIPHVSSKFVNHWHDTVKVFRSGSGRNLVSSQPKSSVFDSILLRLSLRKRRTLREVLLKATTVSDIMESCPASTRVIRDLDGNLEISFRHGLNESEIDRLVVLMTMSGLIYQVLDGRTPEIFGIGDIKRPATTASILGEGLKNALSLHEIFLSAEARRVEEMYYSITHERNGNWPSYIQ